MYFYASCIIIEHPEFEEIITEKKFKKRLKTENFNNSEFGKF